MKNNALRGILAGCAVLAGIIIGGHFFLDAIYVPPILTYHSIDGNEDKTKLSVTAASFALQMEYFARHHYNVVSLDTLVDYIRTKKKIPPRTITITFDDGRRNNYLVAYPILKRYNFPATFFVVTAWVGGKEYMTWEDLKELSGTNITIGSHTVTHPWLPALDDTMLYKEFADSKAVLEKHIAKPVDFTSYPLGGYDRRVQEMAKKAGYKAACGTNPGRKSRWDDLFALKRIKISRTSNKPLTRWFETSGYYTFVKELGSEK
ncbi:MAG: polysaccharide deacetylase family protein [Candidatus Omnitrophica bacterium]|nr:polysaccharide deacetylase family protein [Candidatus Omnitrophota bacterium]